jgi:hypothetical protein
MARWLSGGIRWNMFDHSIWRPGLATLIAPLYWFTDDSTIVYQGALAVNAAAAGLAAVLVAHLTRRLTDLGPIACVLTGGVIALAPASLSASSYVWAEATVTVTFLATVLCVVRFADQPRLSAGIAAIVAAVAGFTFHSRLLTLIPVVTLYTVVAMWRLGRWRRSLALAFVAAITTLLSYGYSNYIYGAVWDDPLPNNTAANAFSQLGDPLAILDALIGQIWYQLVATIGIAGVGIGVLVSRSLRPIERDPAAKPARLVLMLVVPLVLLSATFISNGHRPDQIVYGRYNDAVMWPVLGVGIAWAVDIGGRTMRSTVRVAALVVATTAVCAALLLGLHGETLRSGLGLRAMIPGLMVFFGDATAIQLARWTAIAMLAFAMVVAISGAVRRPVPILGLVALMGIPLLATRTHDTAAVRLNDWGLTAEVTAVEGLLPPDVTVGIRFVPDSQDPAISRVTQRQRAQLYQFYLPDHLFLRDGGTDDSVGPYVFAPVGDAELSAVDAVVLWTDRAGDMALWKEPASSP